MPKPLCNVGLVSGDIAIYICGGIHLNQTQAEIYAFNGDTEFNLIGRLAVPDAFPHAEACITYGRKSLLVGKNHVFEINPSQSNTIVFMAL
jgi:hypothetical protein